MIIWDSDYGASFYLCACLYHNPYQEPLHAASGVLDEILHLLEQIRPIVEAHGAHLVNSSQGAKYWWPQDRRAQP